MTYARLPASIRANLIIAVPVCLILWDVANHLHLIAWFLVLLCTSLSRIMLYWHFNRANTAVDDIARWDGYFMIPLLITAVTLSVGTVSFMPDSLSPQQGAMLLIITVVAGFALGSYTVRLSLVMTLNIILLVPLTVLLIYRGGLVNTIMAFSISLFIYATHRYARNIQNMAMRNADNHELEDLNLRADQTLYQDKSEGATRLSLRINRYERSV